MPHLTPWHHQARPRLFARPCNDADSELTLRISDPLPTLVLLRNEAAADIRQPLVYIRSPGHCKSGRVLPESAKDCQGTASLRLLRLCETR
eukprot:2083122-Rhodomonas_salina.1